jgi:hypothetical protein
MGVTIGSCEITEGAASPTMDDPDSLVMAEQTFIDVFL